MNKKPSMIWASLALTAFFFSGPAIGAQQADNSKSNQGDANKDAVTAQQQKTNPADQQTTAQIRKALMKDSTLSTYAHNVKIITQDGKVTLKGPVRSDDEKSAVESKAAQVAGADNVTDELTVAPPK